MSTTPASRSTETIAIVGDGRLGRTLARALRAAGFAVHGPLSRGDLVRSVDIAILCVPDSAIVTAAHAARPHATLLGHVSGATPLDDVDFSIHPLQTFTGTESPDVFHGIGVAIAGRTDHTLDTAEHLALALGAHPYRIDDAHRADYHAAASFASNFVLTILDAAEQLARSAGIPSDDARRLLAPLAHRTVDNWAADGADRALTGPIARGDDITVDRQRNAAADAHLQALFDELATATRAIADRAATATRPEDVPA